MLYLEHIGFHYISWYPFSPTMGHQSCVRAKHKTKTESKVPKVFVAEINSKRDVAVVPWSAQPRLTYYRQLYTQQI